jgi:integrase
MPRKVKNRSLDSREARSRLKARGMPYYVSLDKKLHLGYRRLRGKAGSWWARHYLGNRQYEVEPIGTADDLTEADGREILDYWQAQSNARAAMAKRSKATADEGARSLTVRAVVEGYIAKRDVREAKWKGRAVRSDAHRLARYVTGRQQSGKRSAITAAKLADVQLHALTEDHLTKWRNTLPAAMTDAGRRRVTNDLRAALNTAWRTHKKHLDPLFPTVIKDGLTTDRNDDDAAEPRARDNQILTDAQVTELIRSAAEVDDEQKWDGDLYRMVLVLAATGTRFSQAARLNVEDCQFDKKRLFIPKSRKGRGTKTDATPMAIGDDILGELQPAVIGRRKNAPLLERWRHRNIGAGKWERAERGPWLSASELDRPWEAIRERAKMPGTIPYALRHSSIVRGIKQNLPIRLVAAMHDTSVVMIERHYAKWIVDGLDDMAARAVVPLVPQKDGAQILSLRHA